MVVISPGVVQYLRSERGSEESVDGTDASQLFCNSCFAASVLWQSQSRVVAMTIAPTIAAAQMAPSKIYFRLFELG